MNYILGLGIAFLVSALLIPIVKRLAIKIGAVDNPEESARKLHKTVIARAGGLAIYVAFILVSIALMGSFSRQFIGLVVAGTMVLAIGLVDDIKRLSPWLKLSVQVLAAIVASVGFGITIESITNPLGETLSFYQPNVNIALLGLSLSFNWVAVLLAIFWLVGMTNTINFLDGIDGLSGGVSAIAAGVIFLLAVSQKVNQPETAMIAIILMGSCLGFLIYNFYPAKIFNGDSGAYFLGMTLGILAIFSGAKLATAALVLGLPILDAIWAVVRRLAHKQSPFTADRGHLHYMFLDAGFSQRQAVLCIYMICLIFGLIGILGSTHQKVIGIIAMLVVMALLLVGLTYAKKRKLG
ncbi:undecaprenyl/decaprenyl-phosphate alpha-N-acetylglucosaminyl 1-phosphate transferase [Candidatus Saccharibacteria bacterium]|nr:undecaprenyl/decaprenyl-phosphate alpha-N-acetylglucosaminyl 1-phosphate transferase [Candidatus Saccharibacteria bacterium]